MRLGRRRLFALARGGHRRDLPQAFVNLAQLVLGQQLVGHPLAIELARSIRARRALQPFKSVVCFLAYLPSRPS